MTILNRSSSLRCAFIHQHHLIPRFFYARLSPSWLTLSGLERKKSKQPSLQETFTMFLMATLSSILFRGHEALHITKLSRSMYNTRPKGMARATVVFDGNEERPSPKDCAHQRRSSVTGPSVNFDGDMVLKLKKNVFLSYPAKKQRHIKLLGEKLQLSRCIIYPRPRRCRPDDSPNGRSVRQVNHNSPCRR